MIFTTTQKMNPKEVVIFCYESASWQPKVLIIDASKLTGETLHNYNILISLGNIFHEIYDTVRIKKGCYNITNMRHEINNTIYDMESNIGIAVSNLKHYATSFKTSLCLK